MILTVAIESPFKANERFTQAEHVMYARLAMLDSLKRGEAPFASHLLYTQVWDDNDPKLRAAGIAAGLAISERLSFGAFYVDLGWSSGMLAAKSRYATWKERIIFSTYEAVAILAGEIKIADIYKERVHV